MCRRVAASASRGAYTCTWRDLSLWDKSCRCRDHRFSGNRLPDTFGLDTADLHRLLDHRFAFETNCQVASKICIIARNHEYALAVAIGFLRRIKPQLARLKSFSVHDDLDGSKLTENTILYPKGLCP